MVSVQSSSATLGDSSETSISIKTSSTKVSTSVTAVKTLVGSSNDKEFPPTFDSNGNLLLDFLNDKEMVQPWDDDSD